MGKGSRKKTMRPEPTAAPMTGPATPIMRMDTAVRVILVLMLVAVVLALYPYTRDATAPIKYLILAWGTVVAAFMSLVLGTLQNAPLRLPRVFLSILAAFVMANLLAAILSSHSGHALVAWRRFATLFVVYLTAAQVYREPRHISNLMLVACIGVTLSTAYAVMQYTGLDPFPWESTAGLYSRLPGTFGNPNYAAHTMILCIVMAVFLASNRRLRWCAAFAVLFLVHMRFTQQRGGLVGLAAAGALLVVALGVRRYVAAPRRAAALTLVIVALLVPVAVVGALAMSKARTGAPVPLGRSLLLRYHGYDGAVRMMLASPVSGYGPGNYQLYNPYFWTVEEQEWFAAFTRMNQRVHNDILESGVEAGFPGAVLYTLFLVVGMAQGLIMGMSAKSAVRRRLGWTFAALFCAYLVDGIFGFNLRLPVSALLLFLLAGALDGMYCGIGPGTSQRGRFAMALAFRMALVIASLVFALYETRTFAAERQMQMGRGAFVAEAFPHADGHFRRAETLSPWDWLAPFERAKCALRMAEHLATLQREEESFAMRCLAAEHFERSSQNNPTYILSLLGAAETHFSLGHTKTPFNRDTRETHMRKARLAAERVVELCPLMPDGHDILGRVFFLQALEMGAVHSREMPDGIRRHWQMAMDHLQRAAELGARDRTTLYLMLAQAGMNTGEVEGAEDALHRALDADPANENLLPLIAQFGGNQFGRYEFVRDTLRVLTVRLRRHAPEQQDMLARAAVDLASIEHRVFKNEENAERAYVQAVRAAPGRGETWAAFAQFSKQSNRPEVFQREVTKAYRDAADAGNEPLPQIRAVAEVWEHGGARLAEAAGALAGAFREALDEGMEARYARLVFGWPAEVLLVEAQKPDLAQDARGIALLEIGAMLHAMDILPLAASVLQAAANELPPKQAAKAALEASRVFERQNRGGDALRMLQKAVGLDPEDAEMRVAFASALAQQGHTAAAREEYRRILEMPGLGDALRETASHALRGLP